MDLLAGLMTGSLQASTPAPDADFWYQPVSGPVTAAGLRIDAEGAQKISAYYRGVDLLSTSLAMLPLPLWRRLPKDEGREQAREEGLYDVLHRKPNPWQDSFTWRRQQMRLLIHYGNSYNRILAGSRGFVGELWPIHPKCVTPELTDAGRKVYHIRDPKRGTTTTVGDDQMFHLCGASDDGVIGKGVLDYARDSLGLGVVLEQYASKLFSKGAMNGGTITVPAALQPDATREMAKSYVTAMQDWHMPRILTHGATWTSSTMDPEKAQMILSRKFTINDIARWLGLPPHMLGDLDRATFSNIEHQAQEFVDYSLGPWLALWEFAINDQLLLEPETYYAEFIRDALVRGDIKTRWETYVAGVNAGILTPNEPRRKENLRAMPDGDTIREPQNITGRGAAGGPQDSQAPRRAAQDDGRGRAIAVASAGRVLRKEIAAMQKLAVRHAADQDGWAAAVAEFYAGHVALVMDSLQMSQGEAERYCAGQAAHALNGWVSAVDIWRTEAYAEGLASVALDEEMAA